MKEVYGYIRVSTKEQVSGASLPEQKSAILEFAKKNDLKIIHFYKESKTAAKKGRPFFIEMIKNLKEGKADGVIMHKIDRSARNLHDWASIGDLIDMDIDVYFAHESLDMNERGGRLSADIQAVMASDYVRNLRQETIKGLYGRLKQGYFPYKSPIGYVDNGKAAIKTIDPIQGELVKQLFNLYLSDEYNIRSLSKEMEKRGLRNKNGNRVCKNGISRIFKNPFYIGLMKSKDKLFVGNHKPLIDERTFKQVQYKLNRWTKSKDGVIHDYLFRKLIRCKNCKYIMTGGLQKGMVYYRCKTKTCKTKCYREDFVEMHIQKVLKSITLRPKEISILTKIIEKKKTSDKEIQKKLTAQLNLDISKLEHRKERLLDAYMDNVIDKEEYEKRKEKFLYNLVELKEQKSKVKNAKEDILAKIENLVKLCKSPLKTYLSGIKEEKREILKTFGLNLTINQKKLEFTMVSPFYELANRDIVPLGAHDRDTGQTLPCKIVYSDKNTSAIIPKPLNKKQLEHFFDFLLQIAPSLHLPDNSEYSYEIPTDNTRS